MNVSEQYFSVAQAAGKIGVDLIAIIAAIRDRRLPARKRDGHYHVNEDDLMRFADEHFKPKH